MNTQQTQVFAPENHGFFDDLATILMSLSSYLFTLHCTVLSNNPKEFHERNLQEWMSYIQPIKDPNHYLTFEVRSRNQLIVFYPFWIITPMALNGWPQFIEYKYVTNFSDSSGFTINSDQNTRIISRIVGASFISYYESQRDQIETKYSAVHQNWPDPLNFARHIRNGFAHGGVFSISNPQALPVNWRGWQVDFTTNGKRVLFEPDSLGIGDIICLMEDIDSLL